MEYWNSRNDITPAGIAELVERQTPRQVRFCTTTFKNSTRTVTA
jgi:hypothetical protein